MKKLSFDFSNNDQFFSGQELDFMKAYVEISEKALAEGTGAGNEFLGWVNLPKDYNKAELEKIKEVAKRIKKQSEVLIIIGIGGSYLGAKSAIEFLTHSFHNELPKEKKDSPEIYFAGTNISATYLKHLIELIGDRDFSINVISKSGTTTEPAIAFRVLKKLLIEKYGKDGAKDRIYATTDSKKGALKKLATEEGYETFVVPDNIGGRFSVLSAVGLLPIASAGINIDELMAGAKAAMIDYKKPYAENDCYKYAVIRNILNRKGKDIELLINYEPSLHFFSEWWKQLFGESEGKENKGLYPASADFTTDLHSLGQYIQDGKRNIFETLINIESPKLDIIIEEDELNLDGLNYLAGKTMDYVNKMAAKGTRLAHRDGNVPNLIINLPEASPYHLGYMYYFFQKACAISGYLLGVNPFNQPGVEAYKTNMFALLEKPGFEKETEKINKKLK